MPDVLEKTINSIVAQLPGHTSAMCKFTFKSVSYSGYESTKTVRIAAFAATCRWDAPSVARDTDYDEYRCTVKGDADIAEVVIEIKVWRSEIKVRALDADTGDQLPDIGFVLSTPGSPGALTSTLADSWRSQARTTGGPFTLTWSQPYQELQKSYRNGEYEAKIRRKSKVRINWPTGAPQFVNLPAGGTKEHGNVIDVEVEHDGTGSGAQSYFVEVTFDPANSKRTTPKPTLEGGVQGSRGVWRQTFHFGSSTKHTFKVHLGLAGGDKATIKVGGTKECSDATVTVINWRKILYQLTCPVDGDRYPTELPTAVKDALETELDLAFIKFERHAANTLDMDAFCAGTPKVAAKIPGEWLVADGSRDGQQAFLANVNDSSALNAKLTAFNTLPRGVPGVHVVLCDELYVAGETTTRGVAKETESPVVTVVLGSASGHLFTSQLQTPTSSGRGPARTVSPITKVKWKPVGGIPDDHPMIVGHKEKAKLVKGEYVILPAGLGYTESSITLQSFQLTLAGGMAPKGIGPKDRATWPVELLIEYSWVDRTKAAMAYGNLLVCKLPAPSAEGRLTQLVLHELGHAMKQARVPRSRALTTEVQRDGDYGDPPPGVDPHPYSYAGRDHIGPHCHFGLPLKDNFRGEAGQCVMYGATTADKFCADCNRILKAVDLRTLKTDSGAEI